MAYVPQEDGIKIRFMETVENLYGIPVDSMRWKTYDEINDMIEEVQRKRELERQENRRKLR